MGTISYSAVLLSCGFYNLAQAKSMAKSRTAVNLGGRPIRSLPITTFNTRFFQVSHELVWYLAEPWIISVKPLLGVSICLRNALRSNCLFCQIVYTITLSSHFLSRSMDTIVHILWHRGHFHCLYGNRKHSCGSLRSTKRGELGFSSPIFPLPRYHGYNLCSRYFQYRQRLLRSSATVTGCLEITTSCAQKSRS